MTKEEKIQQIQLLIQDDTKLMTLLRMVIGMNLPNQTEEKLDLILAQLSN